MTPPPKDASGFLQFSLFFCVSCLLAALFCPRFSAHVISSLAYPNLLGIKRLPSGSIACIACDYVQICTVTSLCFIDADTLPCITNMPDYKQI
jgi:hypothetical protein